jgi:dTDP-4-dehydrorhamnose 3,5-epimerase
VNIQETRLEGVIIITPDLYEDHRGFFMESYNKEKIHARGIHNEFIQDNHSLSEEAGTLRGLHYQLNPKSQTKLVRVLTGAIYDVVVDIRKSSPTFGQWLGVILSEANKRQLLVPQGFAHGFCTITKHTQVFYKVDEYYSPEHDRGISWNDSDLGIEWPTLNPILSEKDKHHPMLSEAELFL